MYLDSISNIFSHSNQNLEHSKKLRRKNQDSLMVMY